MAYLNVDRTTNSAAGHRDHAVEEFDDVSIELVSSRACSSTSVYGSLMKMEDQVTNSYEYLREDGRYLHAAPQDLSKVVSISIMDLE